MFTQLFVWFLLIEVSLSTTAVTNYPTVELVENVPVNTLVLQLTQETKKHKLVLLNMSGFESNMFSVMNGSVYTTNVIDREQLVAEKRCLDRLSCTIELHILVDDGLAYWVIPVRIIDENDNKPRFGKSEIHLKFRDNVVGGYKIPFSGAMDPDEGRNGQIRYVLDCSSSSFQRSRHLIDPLPSSIDCQSQFELVVLSQSFSLSFDQLALKFSPSSTISHRRNDYELVLYAIDNGQDGKQLQSSMRLRVTIERTEKAPVFTLSQYEFVSISSSINVGTILGRVHAIGSDASRPIYYKIVDESYGIEIGQFTGELVISKQYRRDIDEIELTVEAFHSSESSITPLTTRTKVKIFFRPLDRLTNISSDLDIILSSDRQQRIRRLDNPHSFLVDHEVQIGQSLIKLSIVSHNYPSDIYILSLDSHATTFSLSSSSNNHYLLKTRRLLTSKSIYMLTIGIKHKLSQQWLPNLQLELVVIDQWTTSTSTISTTIDRRIESTTTHENICMENMTYVVRRFENDDEIGTLTVVESTNSTEFSSSSVFVLSSNRSEVTFDGCRMRIDRFEDRLSSNQSMFRLCSSRNCSNITLLRELSPLSIKMQNDLSSWLLPVRPIEIAMLALSIVFIMAAIILALVICRLKGVRVCLTAKNYLFYGKKYGLSNAHHLSSAKVPERVQSIVVRESRSPSFEPIRTQDPCVFNIDQYLERESFPSKNLFILPPPVPSCSSSLQRRPVVSIVDSETPRTSSSSFLQETKQLLDMVSSNPDLDLMRLASEV